MIVSKQPGVRGPGFPRQRHSYSRCEANLGGMSPCQKNKMKGKEKNKTEWGNSLILSRKSPDF